MTSPRPIGRRLEPSQREIGATSVEARRGGFDYRVFFAILLLSLLGAALGAVMSPVPADRFLAESVVFVHANDGGPGDRAEWKAFADALRLPPVVYATRANAAPGDSLDSVRDRISARGDPTSGLARVRGRADNRASAIALADTAANQALDYMRRVALSNLLETEVTTTWEFEDSEDRWASTRSLFASRPQDVTMTGARPRFGASSLRVDCRAAQEGCGAAVAIQRPFGPGTPYEATAYLRALKRTPLRLVLGGSSNDVAVSPTGRVGGAWRLFTVTWTPRSRFSSAELAIQATAGGRHVYFVDSAAVRDPNDPPVDLAARRAARALETVLHARRAAAEDRYTLASIAQPSGTVTPSTGRWALIGALIGLAAVIGGLALAGLARRRQKTEH